METLHPGLYLQEVPGENPIEGVSTSTAAFVGVTERGAIGKSGFVTSWKDFQKQYGGYLNNSYLAYAVRGFFENGGQRAYISRVVHFANSNGTLAKTSRAATKEVKSEDNAVGIFDAASDGVWGNGLQVTVSKGKSTGRINVVVTEDGNFVEKYDNILATELDDILEEANSLVRYTSINDALEFPVGDYKLTGGNAGITDLSASDFIGDEALRTGLHAFDNDNINLVAIPGATDVTTLKGLEAYVEGRKDCNAVVEAPYGMSPVEVREFYLTTANLSSARVFGYNTWIQVNDPIGVGKNPTKSVPPSGHIVGIFARTDNERGVWKTPAGLSAVVRGAIALDYNINDAEHDILNPEGINAIRSFEGEGIVLFGGRTLSSLSEWKYISVRRSADFVAQSILNGTRWAIFEPNDEVLWGKITAVSEAFLRGFWRAGGLRGQTESEAFFVVCNSTTTTAEDIDAGRLFCEIGIAAQKPAEFIIFRLSLL